MTPIPDETVRAAILLLGTPGIEDEQIERDVRALVPDDMTARRLIDWIPEAFGLVLVSHIANKITLPKTFKAKSTAGKWVEFPFEAEPIFAVAFKMAQTILSEGQKEVFQNVSHRSAMTKTTLKALNAGVSLDGACLSGPALIGIPADVYSSARKPFWRRLFGAHNRVESQMKAAEDFSAECYDSRKMLKYGAFLFTDGEGLLCAMLNGFQSFSPGLRGRSTGCPGQQPRYRPRT